MSLDAPAHSHEQSYNHKGKTLYHSVFNLDWLEDFHPKVILDVGAYDFGDSIRMKERYPEARVLAFELLPSNFELHSPHAIGVGVECYRVAVSDSPGEAEYFEGTHIHGVHAQSSLLEPSSIYKGNYDFIVKHKKAEEKTKCTTIEEVCREQNLPVIDFLHLDVEGAEYKVISGIGEIKPRMIFAEFLFDGGWIGQETFQKTLDKLDQMGYNVVKELGHDKLFVLR